MHLGKGKGPEKMPTKQPLSDRQSSGSDSSCGSDRNVAGHLDRHADPSDAETSSFGFLNNVHIQEQN